MHTYLFRKLIRRLPGKVIRLVPKPTPMVIEGYASRTQVGRLCRDAGHARVLVVTDETLFALGCHVAVTEALQAEGIAYDLFHDINAEPDTRFVEAGIRAARKAGAQCIVALGGGSVLDTCKLIAAGMQLPRRSARSLQRTFLLVPKGTLPIIAIPSTAGTGAETTVGAIVKDSRTHTKCDTVVVGLRVQAAILDSALTLHAPAQVTAACGIDALSHGLEGYVADVRPNNDDLRKSRDCVRLVSENLPVVLREPENIEARQAMCLAAFYGGNAINKQLAGYVHAFAHAVGAVYHLPHGCAIALCLLPVMRRQVEACQERLFQLAVACGIATEQAVPAVAADAFLDSLRDLIGQCGLPLDGSVIQTADYPRLVRLIVRDSINYSAPVTFTTNDIRSLLDEIRLTS